MHFDQEKYHMMVFLLKMFSVNGTKSGAGNVPLN